MYSAFNVSNARNACKEVHVHTSAWQISVAPEAKWINLLLRKFLVYKIQNQPECCAHFTPHLQISDILIEYRSTGNKEYPSSCVAIYAISFQQFTRKPHTVAFPTYLIKTNTVTGYRVSYWHPFLATFARNRELIFVFFGVFPCADILNNAIEFIAHKWRTVYEHVIQNADDSVWVKCFLSVGRHDELKFLAIFDLVCYIGMRPVEMCLQLASIPSPEATTARWWCPWAMSSIVKALSLMVCYFVNWEYLVASPLPVDTGIIYVSAHVLHSNIPNIQDRLSTSRAFVLQVGCAVVTHVVSIHTDDKDRRHHVVQTHRTLKFLHYLIVRILLYIHHTVHTCNEHMKGNKFTDN